MHPSRIRLITDSTCDIPQALQAPHGIWVVPHVIIWGDRQYRDRVDLLPEDFYRRLASDPVMPTTSQATVQDFAGYFQRAYEEGAEAVLAIVVSGALSGAIQSATQAAGEAPLPVHVLDSRNASMGLGWQVLAAARAREQGGGLAEMIAAAEYVRERVRLFILLDTLEYVYRGGRIGNARRLLGAALNIKPLIYIDNDTGLVEPGGMALTRRKGLEALHHKFFDNLGPGERLRVSVLHGHAAEEAAVLYERLRVECQPCELQTNITTPTLGVHTGPRAIALCGYME